MKIIAVIPARYGSTRFEGKVLARDTGKYLIQHTYEQACAAKLPEKVIIATDDERVMAACRSFGAECVLTSRKHQSGTDRIAEAVADIDVRIVVNIQADEAEIAPASVNRVARLLLDNAEFPMATLVTDFQNKDQVADPNIVKAVLDCNGKAIYFSRSAVPYSRADGGTGEVGQYLRHLGIYAYRKDFLLKFTSLPETPLELAEKLEQLRAIEYGYSIIAGKVEHTCQGIDTPQQYAEFVKSYGKFNHKP